MQTITGIFDNYTHVATVVDALSDAAIPSADISIVSPDASRGLGTVEAAGVGAAVGGVVATVCSLAVPGFGPLFGAGWLVHAILGAAAGGVAGGLLSGLVGAGIDEKDAQVYAESLRRGSTLVVVRADDGQASLVRAILARAGSIDTASRRSEYEAGGWDGMVQQDIWDQDIGSEDRERPQRSAVAAPPR